MGERPDYKTEIREKLKHVDTSDGVNEEEAIIIAQNDLITRDENVDKFCILSKPTVIESPYAKDCWLVSFPTTLKVKRTRGLKWTTIYIDKKTGEIKGGGASPS